MEAATDPEHHAPLLFESQEEYDDFLGPAQLQPPPGGGQPPPTTGDAYLGIDAGSTTTKLALIAPDGGLLYTYYHSNQRQPGGHCPGAAGARSTPCAATGSHIKGSAVTGYGEDLIKNAFRCDAGPGGDGGPL